MRANVTRLWVAIGAVAVISGCNCDPTPVCEDLFVSFDSPKDGAVGVASTTDVTIKIENSVGTPIELDSAQLVTRASAASEFSVPRDGTLTAGKATFSAVTLEPGANVLKVTVKKKGTACTGTKSITVEVPLSNDPPKVLTFAYPQDTAMPIGVLNSTELPSAADLRIDLTTQFAIGGTVQIFNTANNTPIGNAFTVASSAVSVQIPAAGLADGAYSFFAKVTKGTLSNSSATNAEATKAITFDRTPPTCAVTSPAKALLGPTDDADGAKAGYQLRAAGTTNAKAQTLELKISGGPTPDTSGPLAPVNLALSKDFDIGSTGNLGYTITAEAKDSAGNTCVATRLVTVDFDAPTLTIVSPDGGVETSFNVPMIANVVGGNGGFVEWKVTDSTGTRDLGLVSVDGGVASSVGSFVNGAQTIAATPTDAVGNRGTTVSRPFSVSAATGCSVVFTRPATRPGFITLGSVSGGNYSFQAQSTCANGTPATLRRDGTLISTQNVNNGVVSWNVPVTSGTFKFRAEVGTAPVVFDVIDVTVDLMAPAITQPVEGAALNIAADVAPGSAGIQSGFAFNASIPAGGRADVCSNQTPAPGGSTPCADGAAGWWTLKATVSTPDATFNYPDGSYCLKLVVVSGTTSNVSQQVCVSVDSIAPSVSGLTLLRDADSNKKLNVNELGGLPAEFQFTLGGGHTQSNIRRVHVIEGAAVFNTTSAVTYSGATMNVVNVKLDQGVTATTQTYNWIIEVEDSTGNVGTSALQTVKIDKVAPTCAITFPTVAVLGKPDDAVPGTPVFDLKVDVAGSADTETITFGTTGGQVLSQMVTASSGTGTHTFALTQTAGVVSYGATATCIDDSRNSTTATAFPLSVDLDPPTCAMTAPAASPPQHTQFSLPTSITVGGAGTVGRTVSIFSQVGAAAAVQVGSLVVQSNGTAVGNITYLNGVQSVTSRVTDPVGNECLTTARNIDITSAACAISFVSPTIGSSGAAYFTSTSISVTGNSSNCAAGKAVQLFQVGTATALGSGTTDAGGNVTINGTLAEGGPYTLRLRIDNGSGMLTDTDLTPVFVDITAPTAGSVELNATVFPVSGTSVTFVAATNVNRLPPTPNPAFVQDNTPGGNADFNIKVNAVTGAVGGRVRLVYGGTEMASANVTASPQDVTLNNVSLPHNSTGQVLVQVVDAAGLPTAAMNVPGTVDVQEPAAPTVTRSVTDPRLATVTLQWAATYDDGVASASGANSGYEIRWSTSTVTNNNLLAQEADYLDSAKARPESNQAWIAGTTSRDIRLPPNNAYYVVVRARDEVGNYSPYAAPTPVNNLGTTNTLANPSGVSDQFGQVITANGSINGDAIDDLVVPGAGSAKVYVYFGGPGFTTQAGCSGTACQTINIPVTRTPATESFGNSVMVGSVTEAASPQLIVGSATFNSTQGRAFLFFGGVNADGGTFVDDTSFVELRGDGGQFGRHVAVVPDINGDGFNELSVTARSYNSNRGRVYIFKGRSKTAWQAAAAVAGTILESAADWILEGPAPVATGGNNNFGPQLSISSLGTLTGGNGNDLTVAAAHENANNVYLLSSAAMGDGGVVTTGTPGAGFTNMAFQTLNRATGPLPVFAGFGATVNGNLDVTGAVAKDLIITNPKESSIFVYGDGTPASFGNPVITIQGQSSMGSTLVPADLTGDGRMDLTSSEVAPPGSASRVWVFYNRSASYDGQLGQFFQSVFQGSSTSSGSLGISVARGDFDGDSKPDLALSDTAVPPGRVVIWR